MGLLITEAHIMNQLNDKVAIVTGASSGIGRAAARLFAAEGALVVAGARRERELDQLVAEIEDAGGRAVALPGDVREEDYAQALVALARAQFGGLDIAFNNAGTFGEIRPTPEIPSTEWHETIDTNLTAAFLGAKHQIPAMLERGGGSLIFTSTFVGYTAGIPGVAPYAAGKAGLVGLTKALAVEYGAEGIRVNALIPGGTDTAMAEPFTTTEEGRAFVVGLHALKRIAEPEEIARAALFLASDASSFTTGSTLMAEGGVSVCHT